MSYGQHSTRRRLVSADVPLRRSLLLRLLAASIAIAACSIASTAWLVMRGTTKAIEQEQGRSFANTTHVYDALVGYAATHHSWAGAQSLVDSLTAGSDTRITLTTQDRAVLVGPPPAGPVFASVDPLRVDPALRPDAPPDQIDERALGPYQLTEDEQAAQRSTAAQAQVCLRGHGVTSVMVVHPSGLISVRSGAGAKAQHDCGTDYAPISLTTKIAISQLTELVNDCLAGQRLPAVTIQDTITWQYLPIKADPGRDKVAACLGEGRRKQLAPFVAPAALLFVDSTHPDAAPGRVRTDFTLSSANLARTAGVAALVLAVTVALTVLAGVRLVRPLRALTAAAQHPPGPRARVPVAGRDEIGALAAVLNHEAERRERSEEQRKAMVSDIAHELRTPLSNIRGWLEASEDGIATPISDPQLTAALLAEARQLQHIVDDLQDLAAADAGTLRLDRQRLAIGEFVQRTATAHRAAAEDAGVRLDVSVTGAPRVDADPVRLAQALGNLVTNAIRYTPAGGRVTVTATGSGATAVLRVDDTGPGIAAADLPHVFDRFWRADASRTRETGGSGLGLAIAKHLVEAHGGSIGATSAPGRGASFTIHLPMSPD